MSVHSWISSPISGGTCSVYYKMLYINGPKCSNFYLLSWFVVSVILCSFEYCVLLYIPLVWNLGFKFARKGKCWNFSVWHIEQHSECVCRQWKRFWRIEVFFQSLGFWDSNFWIFGLKNAKYTLKNTDYLKYVFNKFHTERWQILKYFCADSRLRCSTLYFFANECWLVFRI